MTTPTRALFINSGILGQRTFAHFIQNAFDDRSEGIHATQIVLTDQLTARERAIRRLLCLRVWPDGLAGVKNLDLLRYRAEWNAGLVARNRIRRLEAAGARFDVLHFHRQATAYASLDRIRTTPAIVSIDCTQRLMMNAASRPIEARTYLPNARRDGEIFQAARLIVSTSEWAARSLRGDYPACSTDIVVMPNPVELTAFDSSWIAERHARSVRPGGYLPRVLFMGGDFHRKGGIELLDVWRDARMWETARLEIATSTPIAAHELPAGVSVHTRVAAHSPEWRDLWRNADLFVLPTREEAFGIVFQEASAAGLPSIGTRVNAVPEMVDDGISGLLVGPGDKPALVRALDCLISSPDRRREMGTNARRFVARSADPAAYRRDLAAAIERVARR